MVGGFAVVAVLMAAPGRGGPRLLAVEPADERARKRG